MEINESSSSLGILLPNPSSERKRAARRIWARDRTDNIQMVLQHVEGLLLQQYPEHKRCLLEAIQDDIGLLLWKAFEVLKDSDKACDCTIDALTKACKSLERRSLEEVKRMDLKSWLCQCVYNGARTVWRRENRLQFVSLQEAIAAVRSESILWYPSANVQVSEQPEQIIVQQDACRMLASMISSLPAQQVYAILAHHLGGEPYRVVAARYWRSEKAANMAASRGLSKLRAMAERAHLRASDFQSESFRGMLDQALSAILDL